MELNSHESISTLTHPSLLAADHNVLIFHAQCTDKKFCIKYAVRKSGIVSPESWKRALFKWPWRTGTVSATMDADCVIRCFDFDV
jgi:hypothetical protein